MIVYRLSKSTYANDLSGKGAEVAGGRWNNKGTPFIYTSGSRALCLAEVMVHIPSDSLLVDYSMITLEVPDKKMQTLLPPNLPENWRTIPAPSSTRQIGDAFCRANLYLVLKVPSVIVPEEYNYLINPKHPDMSRLKIIHIEAFTFDTRFFKT
jgi:RES domain-containing protein